MGEPLSVLLREIADKLALVGPERLSLAEELRTLAVRAEMMEETLGEYAIELMELRASVKP